MSPDCGRRPTGVGVDWMPTVLDPDGAHCDARTKVLDFVNKKSTRLVMTLLDAMIDLVGTVSAEQHDAACDPIFHNLPGIIRREVQFRAVKKKEATEEAARIADMETAAKETVAANSKPQTLPSGSATQENRHLFPASVIDDFLPRLQYYAPDINHVQGGWTLESDVYAIGGLLFTIFAQTDQVWDNTTGTSPEKQLECFDAGRKGTKKTSAQDAHYCDKGSVRALGKAGHSALARLKATPVIGKDLHTLVTDCWKRAPQRPNLKEVQLRLKECAHQHKRALSDTLLKLVKPPDAKLSLYDAFFELHLPTCSTQPSCCMDLAVNFDPACVLPCALCNVVHRVKLMKSCSLVGNRAKMNFATQKCNVLLGTDLPAAWKAENKIIDLVTAVLAASMCITPKHDKETDDLYQRWCQREGACNLTSYHRSPFFQNGAKHGFEWLIGPSTLGPVAKTRLESRMKKFTPHCMCSHVQHCNRRHARQNDKTTSRNCSLRLQLLRKPRFCLPKLGMQSHAWPGRC